MEPFAAPPSRRVPGSLVAILAALVVAAGGAVAFLAFGDDDRAGPTRARPTPTETPLPGAILTAAPWSANGALLEQRLAAIGLQAVSDPADVVQHLHLMLEISIDGTPVPIPADVGIDPAGTFFAPVHTHDATGEIHLESAERRDYSLGEFFDVWGIPFDDRCLGPYCSGKGARLEVVVDGEPVDDARRLRLREGQEILVLFESGA